MNTMIKQMWLYIIHKPKVHDVTLATTWNEVSVFVSGKTQKHVAFQPSVVFSHKARIYDCITLSISYLSVNVSHACISESSHYIMSI